MSKLKAVKSLEPVNPKEDKNGDGIPDYEVDSAMETLLRAEEHKKNSKLMDKVHAKLSTKKKAITSIQGLKERKQSLLKDEDMDD
jgi:hypothetical protein